MRLIVETLDDIQYWDMTLTEEELDRVRARGICAEFTGTELGKKYLNIFIRTEELEDNYAIEKWKRKESDREEY